MQFNHLRRRKFIVALGSAAAWPRAGRAQQGERVRRVSVIMGFAEADPVWQAYLATFRQRLQEFGWTEGRNVRFDYRFTGESAARMRSAAAEVVAMAPDVIFVSTNPVVSAVLEETRSIPIVFTWVSDSVGSGYMSNLAHPGGNITGFHNYEPALGQKWMGILKEIAPAVRRVAFVHVPEITANVAFMRAGETSGAALGISVSGAAVRNESDLEGVLTNFAKEPNSGLIVTPSPLTATRREVIVDLAARLRLPAVYPFRFYAERRPYLVRHRPDGVGAGSRFLCGSHPAWRKCGRSSRAAADQISACDQYEDGEDAGAQHSEFDATARGRGYRVAGGSSLIPLLSCRAAGSGGGTYRCLFTGVVMPPLVRNPFPA